MGGVVEDVRGASGCLTIQKRTENRFNVGYLRVGSEGRDGVRGVSTTTRNRETQGTRKLVHRSETTSF